ncbi:MAG: helix-turn-helix transcriptional regulator [Acidimicrobiales bacterium]
MPLKRSADERLQRLLAVVPWVAERDGPRLAEVCTRFGLTQEELLDDLRQLFLCGLYPYTPDVLIDVDIADGRVWIRYAEYFSRPLRLTPAEALALLAAGQSVMAAPGTDPNGPLGRGLAKLGRALGVEGGEALDISLGGVAEGIMETIRPAVEARLQVEIDYYAFGRDEWTTRVIDPFAVFSAGGQWYLSAFCHRVDDERLFRMDRVRSLRVLAAHFTPPAVAPELCVYRPGDGDPRVTLELEPQGRWVVEQYPVESVHELGDGRSRVTMAVSNQAWADRLLLRLGPVARVVDSAGRADPSAVAAAARRVLARYREGSGSLPGT